MASTSDPAVLLETARQQLATGQFAAAEASCLRVLGTHQHHPGALGILGQVLYAQGRHEEAVRVFNALAQMQPTVAEHWRNLATALRPTKRYDQAIAAFDRALRLAPPTAALLYNLGVLQMERYDYNAAYLALRDGVALAPTDGTLRWAFAQCCYEMVNVEEALTTLEEWQKLQGLTVTIVVRICFLLVMMGATQRAQPALDRLLANPPQRGREALGVASIMERLHRLDEARALLERLAVADPSLNTDPERLLLVSTLAERAGSREEARGLVSAALEHQQDFVQRYHFLYPLARIEDAAGHYDEAFAAAEEAHHSQLAFLEIGIGKSPQVESRILARAAHDCDPDDVATWGSDGPAAQDSPIFIVGFPRSGTTLLEQVLDAHPLLRSMDEQPFLLRAHSEVIDRGSRYPAELGRLTAADLEALRAGYWSRVSKKVSLAPGERLVDKNPMNMVLLPLIRRLFPQAHIILAIRHPCDVLLSCYLQDFRAPELALLCRDLGTLAAAYARVFEFWYSQWPLLRPSTHELRYEQLTADFPTEVRKLNTFLQLPWDDAMLQPQERARAKGFISTPSYTQVLEPVNRKSVGRWKRYERHFGAALPLVTPWIQRWGYDVN
jgi:tetratricopeptide (TPR) repeat protein